MDKIEFKYTKDGSCIDIYVNGVCPMDNGPLKTPRFWIGVYYHEDDKLHYKIRMNNDRYPIQDLKLAKYDLINSYYRWLKGIDKSSKT